jgi:uncharacterized protein (TIGR02266 family)
MKPLELEQSESVEGLDAAAFESRRVPLERKVILKFHHFGGFFIEYSANISLTGMFIKTDAPKAPGSVFIFEIWLGDEYKLVHGLGEVVWVRDDDEGLERPSGMGVRFLKIDAESRSVIERIVAEHLQRGGQVFDLGAVSRPSVLMREDNHREGPESAASEGRPPGRLESAAGSGELLVLDEDELGLALSLDASTETSPPPVEPRRPRRRFRIAALLAALAAAMGGLAYLFSAGLLTL